MSESFLQLPASDQLEVLQLAGERLGRRPAMLEKDVWVVWTLEQLFSLEGQQTDIPGLRDARVPRMAFKGGTSLSKVFRAIGRFSEDVDIAFDQTAFQTTVNAFATQVSSHQLEKHRQQESKIANAVLEQVIAPGLRAKAIGVSSHGTVSIETALDVDGSVLIFVKYPSLASDAALRESVKLEIGGRNPTEPTSLQQISTDLAEVVPELEYPTATVSVLDAERTFWEKVTLIHAECHRERFDLGSVERKSRHWSDLAELSQLEIAAKALKRRDLLETVIAHKSRFYRSPRSCYEDCLLGKIRLIPEESDIVLLEHDYLAMESMFFKTPMPFATVLELLRELETKVNLKAKT
jgi:Nucleotidyl transferase AbiEii toxin, Type IV TA system